jgi:predicted phosphodiesterase
MSNTLVIGDIHEPFCMDRYFQHCKKIRDQYNCTKTVFLGDVADQYAVSTFTKSQFADGPSAEFVKTRNKITKWVNAFPEALVCIGNHDLRYLKRAREMGIPTQFLRGFNEIWGTPTTWKWDYTHSIDGVVYRHGEGRGGLYPHVGFARAMRKSVVIGHYHAVSGIEFLTNDEKSIFGMCLGSGVDPRSYAVEYAMHSPAPTVHSCGVVINGKTPVIEVM